MERFLSRRRWLIPACGALIQLFSGIPAAWGAFQTGIESGFQLSRDSVIFMFSLVITAYGIGCVGGGLLQDKCGPRIACLIGACGLGGGFFLASFLPQGQAGWLYLGFSLPVGLGCAFLYPAVMSCVQKWYPRQRGFATGLIGAAVGLSGAVLTFGARWLSGSWGIRVCFRVLGIVIGVLCTLGALVMAEPSAPEEPSGISAKGVSEKAAGSAAQSAKKAHSGAAAPEVPPQKLFCHRQYWLLLAAVACSTPAVLLFSPTILQLGRQRGLSEDAAALAIVFGSLSSAAGRLAMPWLSDRIGRKYADLFLFGGLAIFSFLFSFAQQVWVIVLYACLTFCYSGSAALLPAFAADLFGQKWCGVNYGLLALGMSAGSLAFPFLARAFSGAAACHWIAVSAACLGLLLLLFLPRSSPIQP